MVGVGGLRYEFLTVLPHQPNPDRGSVYTASGDFCDPGDAADAVGLVNRYLANGRQLLNTDAELWENFRRSGALRDVPWWRDELDAWAPNGLPG